MNKQAIIDAFDPNGVGAAGSLFGLPFSPENAELIVIPVPWEVTVSYAAGTARGPEAILKASSQVDLHERDLPEAWKYGIAMLPVPEELRELSNALRAKAERYIRLLEEEHFTEEDADALKITAEITKGCEQMIHWVEQTAAQWRAKGKAVALVGGDHSTPLGLIRDVARNYPSFGILQIDAHADLRVAYEGFKYSHASIIYNALQLEEVEKVVQVGIRDFCESEAAMVEASKGRIITHYFRDLASQRFCGATWNDLCQKIIAPLPQKVYVTADIDGLDPKLCPNTGTPVPGGFEFEEVNFLLTELAASGREIVGFDLNEVSPGAEEDALETNDWDGNVGARLLYRMCNLMAASNKALQLQR